MPDVWQDRYILDKYSAGFRISGRQDNIRHFPYESTIWYLVYACGQDSGPNIPKIYYKCFEDDADIRGVMILSFKHFKQMCALSILAEGGFVSFIYPNNLNLSKRTLELKQIVMRDSMTKFNHCLSKILLTQSQGWMLYSGMSTVDILRGNRTSRGILGSLIELGPKSDSDTP